MPSQPPADETQPETRERWMVSGVPNPRTRLPERFSSAVVPDDGRPEVEVEWDDISDISAAPWCLTVQAWDYNTALAEWRRSMEAGRPTAQAGG